MTYHWVRLFGITGILVALAACGGGGGSAGSTGAVGSGTVGDGGGGDDGGPVDPPPVSPFASPSEAQALFYVQDFDAEFDAVYENYDFGGLTPNGDLPRPNIVTYSGWMEIAFFTTPVGNIHSDAVLDVDMMTGATSGSASAFIGWVQNPDTGFEELALYEGDILFTGGALGTLSNGGTSFEMEIAGDLDNGMQEFNISGLIDGGIFGANAEGLFAAGSSSPLSSDIALTADNVTVDGTAAIWALKD